MTADFAWRGDFTNGEINLLHADAFDHAPFGDWDWRSQVDAHSLGWVVARFDERLVGFLNVIWDGRVHAWIQDVMVATTNRHEGVGLRLVEEAVAGARDAGCEWLHVDFDPGLRSFYIEACGFTDTGAGLIALR